MASFNNNIVLVFNLNMKYKSFIQPLIFYRSETVICPTPTIIKQNLNHTIWTKKWTYQGVQDDS